MCGLWQKHDFYAGSPCSGTVPGLSHSGVLLTLGRCVALSKLRNSCLIRLLSNFKSPCYKAFFGYLTFSRNNRGTGIGYLLRLEYVKPSAAVE